MKTRWLILLALSGLILPHSLNAANLLGGAFTGQPEEIQKLSPCARALIDQAFADLGPQPLVDYHAHIVGVGQDQSGAEVNPDMLTWRHPIRRLTTGIYLSAAAITDLKQADQQYLQRLVRLARNFGHPIQIHILAFDHHYNADGTINYKKTEFYVPNERIVDIARQYPDIFVPVISVHPYRLDALAEVETWARQGVRYIKWLPNAQGINPADPRIDPFYQLLKRYQIVLLTHTGKEMAVDAADAQELGNPLLLRRPLDIGVQVIAAHCASLGRGKDLDHPGQEADNVDLFLRLMSEPRYQGRLFGDLSATTQINRVPRLLQELFEHPQLQGRLVNGSDYPLPAVNCVISTRKLENLGMLTSEQRRGLNEIYHCNPLLFDYVLKRTLHDPRSGQKLAAGLFQAHPDLAQRP